MLVIATSNQNLRDRVAQGVFRDDLYARLAASEIAVPSLRDRVADIPVLPSVPGCKASRRRPCARPWGTPGQEMSGS
jgi:DNA-binding NtrC family response regulator